MAVVSLGGTVDPEILEMIVATAKWEVLVQNMAEETGVARSKEMMLSFPCMRQK